MDILENCNTEPLVIVANHDRINEKSKEHSLEFMRHIAHLINDPIYVKPLGAYLIPYYHDVEELRAYLKTLPKGARLIMHQGLNGSDSGEYIQDRSALNPEDVQDFRVISGHYHRRQDIKTGRPRKGALGLFSYIGNPYSLNFAEAKDPAKGFQILMDDNLLEFVPTNLRRHLVSELTVQDLDMLKLVSPVDDVYIDDLVWVKVKATSDILANVTKTLIAKHLGLEQSFRLDLIPTEKVTNDTINERKELSQPALLNHLIDNVENTDHNRKTRLKDLWNNLLKG